MSPQTQEVGTVGNVVVATAFTDRARLAIERAARLPLRAGASIELAHVTADNEPEADGVCQRLHEERDRFFGQARAHEVLTTSLRGDIAPEVSRLAHHAHADLVVIGRHGARSWRDVVLGTTADRIVRKAPTSTLVVSSHAAGPYRRPLVAVDFSPSSRLAVQLAARLASGDEPISVLHVVSFEDYIMNHTVAALETDATGRREAALAEGLERLQHFIEDAHLTVPWRPIVVLGEAAGTIIETVGELGADLVAVGSTGKGFIKRAFLGSVAERVMRGVTCDALVARHPLE